MKTQKKSTTSFIPFFICAGMMILFSLIERPSFAQPCHTKTRLENNLRMIVTLFRQPFISRKSQRSAPYDVIIVPGIPYYEDKNACLIMKARIIWAHYLLSEGIAKNVIFSGSAVYSPYTESRIMALYAVKLGIPADHIFCETKAEHSTENVVYSCRMAEELGFKRIAIATGPFQSAFLDRYVKDHSIDISFLPISLLSMGKADPVSFTSIDPSTAFAGEFISLKERESRSERYQGTLGYNIAE